MSKPERNWIERPGRDPEKEAAKLKRRFSSITGGYERAVANRKFLRSRRATILFALLAAAIGFAVASAMFGR